MGSTSWSLEVARLGETGEGMVKGGEIIQLLSSLKEMETIVQELGEWMAALKESSLDPWSLYHGRKKDDDGDEPELETGQH